ncbi:Hypothetical protein PHPALM_9701 [Phytophthora palmivora]|uniref:Uncharacterized protein n=1 Tax=Phytophthora palmivora TaxID=4796 RepID=A0A2P4Y6L5_9STRA|nr:Hypothetical protein PHPALM_9701 [Phytophthora palmivora]
MIIQSNDIMACISNEINQHKKKLIELNQTLSETLAQSHAVSSAWENTLIRSTSANIQVHEKSIKKLKKDREVEIVRIVQFSRNVREALKIAFQLNLEVQLQQKQHHQQFQQNG